MINLISKIMSHADKIEFLNERGYRITQNGKCLIPDNIATMDLRPPVASVEVDIDEAINSILIADEYMNRRIG
jgi:hypothetical protein